MGAPAKAYHEIDNYELVGLVSRSSKDVRL